MALVLLHIWLNWQVTVGWVWLLDCDKAVGELKSNQLRHSSGHDWPCYTCCMYCYRAVLMPYHRFVASYLEVTNIGKEWVLVLNQSLSAGAGSWHTTHLLYNWHLQRQPASLFFSTWQILLCCKLSHCQTDCTWWSQTFSCSWHATVQRTVCCSTTEGVISAPPFRNTNFSQNVT